MPWNSTKRRIHATYAFSVRRLRCRTRTAVRTRSSNRGAAASDMHVPDGVTDTVIPCLAQSIATDETREYRRRMDVTAPQVPGIPTGRLSAEQYLRLIDDGVLGPDDRVELLEGVVVSMAAQNSPHASGVARANHALILAVGGRAVVRTQLTFVAGEYSVPEPDVAVVAGRYEDYDAVHPHSALLIVEVADTSLAQDRITKAGIYAAADIPEYWIVDVRGQRVEVYREPACDERRYRVRSFAHRGEQIELAALPGVVVTVHDLLPIIDR